MAWKCSFCDATFDRPDSLPSGISCCPECDNTDISEVDEQ